MDKELILKAVQAVMDFNECHGCGYAYSASIDVGMHSVWVRVFKFDTLNGAEYVLNNNKANSDDLNNFIQKLDELKAV